MRSALVRARVLRSILVAFGVLVAFGPGFGCGSDDDGPKLAADGLVPPLTEDFGKYFLTFANAPVGDPMTLDGGDQPIRQRARTFARELRTRFALPVAMMDERNSSQEAARRFAAERADGRRKRRDADLLDAVAAAVIVERWLSAPQDAIPIEE